jgi:nitric oxide reductase large subunit
MHPNLTIMPEEKNEKKSSKKEDEKLHVYFVDKVVTLMTGAMGLVAALAWNDAMRKLFERIFGTQGSGDVTAMFIYAAIVTAAVVIITYRLTRFAEKMKRKKEK